MELTTSHFIGMAAALILVLSIGIFSGRQVHSSADFTVSGRRAGAFLVMGALLGTLVGGSCTIGTAQLAFRYGFSAWWFTLGGGIACLIMAIFLVRPMRRARLETVSQFLQLNFGASAGLYAAIFLSLSMFISIIPQILSSIVLLSAMFPRLHAAAAPVAALLIILYVIFGGLWSSGYMGLSKVMLTAVSLLGGGILAFILAGGAAGLGESFPRFPWFSLFGRGLNTDLASGFSLLVGVLSSQVYFQALFAGRDLTAARRGAFFSAILVPVIGLAAIMIGLFMRAHYPQLDSAQALPAFVLLHLPPWCGGVVLATLLLVSIGTGAGLTLGISTTLSRDIFLRLRPGAGDKQRLLLLRALIVIIVLLALAAVYLAGSDVLILQLSYLSLGLRGAAICMPLLAAIFFKDWISPKAASLTLLLAPLSVIAGSLAGLPFNSLYLGLAVNLVILLTGLKGRGKLPVSR